MSTNTTPPIAPFGVDLDLATGAMRDPQRHTLRRASDMRGYYQDAAALEALVAAGDPPHYEVFEKPVPEQYGHLMFCISKLYPGRVGDECWMTKGHYHEAVNTAETYLCLAGRGWMMCKTAEGLWRAEPMERGRMVYVPPYWAHRSINTGDDPLVSFCVYPAEAGHNYRDIAQHGFPRRVFVRHGAVVIE